MKAARLHADRTLHIDYAVQQPTLKPSGSVLVKVIASTCLSYSNDVISGKLSRYDPGDFPVIFGPGCVGTVEATSADVFDYKPGDVVVVDPQMGSRQIGGGYDEILIGLTAVSGPPGKKIQKIWPNGCWADFHLAPIQAVTPLPRSSSSIIDPLKLSALSSRMELAFHGLERAGFKPGMTVVVNGATGSYGAVGCLVALAAGGSKVIGVGRNQSALSKLSSKLLGSSRYSASRFTTVSSASAADFSSLLNLATSKTNANTGADIIIDLVGNATSADSTLSCLRSLKRGGSMVIQGSMSSTLELSYGEMMLNNWSVIGNYMYPPETTFNILPLLESGQLDVSVLQVHEYPLEKASEAVEHAAKCGPLEFAVIVPNKA